jgi:hypothetical protein
MICSSLCRVPFIAVLLSGSLGVQRKTAAFEIQKEIFSDKINTAKMIKISERLERKPILGRARFRYRMIQGVRRPCAGCRARPDSGGTARYLPRKFAFQAQLRRCPASSRQTRYAWSLRAFRRDIERQDCRKVRRSYVLGQRAPAVRQSSTHAASLILVKAVDAALKWCQAADVQFACS